MRSLSSDYPGIYQVVRDVTGWDVPDRETERDSLSKLWAEDWDSPEDAAYDALAKTRDEEDEQFDKAMRNRRRDAQGDLDA